jgi:hypothetical protein
MADANEFYVNFRNEINIFSHTLENLSIYEDRLNSDSTLAQAAADAAKAAGRTDLVAADFTNAASAIQQIIFTYGSGSPTQKSYLYKIL